MEFECKNYNTTLRIDLIRNLKILAAKKDTRVKDFLEETIQDLLKKHKKKEKITLIESLILSKGGAL